MKKGRRKRAERQKHRDKVIDKLVLRDRGTETKRQGDREAERQKDRRTVKQWYRETKRQRDRLLERQRERKPERLTKNHPLYWKGLQIIQMFH